MPYKTTVQYFCRHIFFPHLVSFKNIIRKSAVEFICLSNEKDASYNYWFNLFVPYRDSDYSNTVFAKHKIVAPGSD